jgi:DNA-binding NarL/FixJ family response regulator
VLIADDQPSARRSLHALLTAMRWSAPGNPEQPTHAGLFSIEVVGVAEDGRQAVEQVQALYPDVVVMDLHLHTMSATEAGMDALATIRMIKSGWPAVRIVVLTMYATSRSSVLSAGADAFLLKGCSTKELMEAVMPGPSAAPGIY